MKVIKLIKNRMNVISIRENPNYRKKAIQFIQEKWANDNSLMVYEDCINNSIKTSSPLPHWYLLEKEGEIIGCAGLITNDFISRMDLFPWFSSLYIEKEYRGQSLGSLMINKAKEDANSGGFSHLFLCTDHIGYYEKYGFNYIGTGYHPWGESSRIYSMEL